MLCYHLQIVNITFSRKFMEKCFLEIYLRTASKKFHKATEWDVPCLNVAWYLCYITLHHSVSMTYSICYYIFRDFRLHDVWLRYPGATTIMNRNPKYVFFNYDTPLDLQPKELPANLMVGWLNPIQIPADQQVASISYCNCNMSRQTSCFS